MHDTDEFHQLVCDNRYERDRKMLLLLLGLCVFRLDFVQSDLQIILTNVEVQTDDEYFEQCSATPCENDDMVPQFDMDCTVIKQLPDEGTLSAVLYGMANGEFTEPTGVDMLIEMCQMVNETIILIPLFKAMGVPLKCPLDPSTMHLDCYSPPLNNLPDFFPPGDFKFVFDLKYEDTHLFVADVYFTVY